MLKFLKFLPTLAVGVGFLTMVSSSAQASVVFVFEGVVPGPVAGQTTYQYDLNFVTTVDSMSGSTNDRFVAGSTFGTLYDIVGFINASVTAGSPFTFSTQLTGITPVGIAPTDSGSLTNITVNYTGPTTTMSTSFPLLLTVNSSATAINPNGQYSGQDVKNAGSSAGTLATNFGFVAVPSAATPEPASMFTMAGGALLLLAGNLRRKKA